jgi:hypothetical protein
MIRPWQDISAHYERYAAGRRSMQSLARLLDGSVRARWREACLRGRRCTIYASCKLRSLIPTTDRAFAYPQ